MNGKDRVSQNTFKGDDYSSKILTLLKSKIFQISHLLFLE